MRECKIILEYKLPHKWGRVVVEIPGGALAMGAGFRADGPVIWAFVNTDDPMVSCVFYNQSSGSAIPDTPVSFIGSVQGYDGLTWHVFQEVR